MPVLVGEHSAAIADPSGFGTGVTAESCGKHRDILALPASAGMDVWTSGVKTIAIFADNSCRKHKPSRVFPPPPSAHRVGLVSISLCSFAAYPIHSDSWERAREEMSPMPHAAWGHFRPISIRSPPWSFRQISGFATKVCFIPGCAPKAPATSWRSNLITLVGCKGYCCFFCLYIHARRLHRHRERAISCFLENAAALHPMASGKTRRIIRASLAEEKFLALASPPQYPQAGCLA